MSNNPLALTLNQFIEKAYKKHGNKYNYSLVEYKSAHINIKIICSKHGIFEQKPGRHLLGHGCSECRYDLKRLTKDEFIEKSIKFHGEIYDYSLVEYKNNSTNVKIICPKHGIFEQRPANHINGQQCPHCEQKISKGVVKIKIWLDNNNIKYELEKRFSDCKSKNTLPFDFYLPNYNICIEFDGQQHYYPHSWFDRDKSKMITNLKEVQFRDNIKNNYCIKENIKLIRIPFWRLKSIEKILFNSILIN